MVKETGDNQKRNGNMSKGKFVILITTAVLIMLTPPFVKAEYITDAGETLRGIQSIFVVVKKIHQEAHEHGFTNDTIQKDVVSQLEQAGIEVIPLKKFPTLDPYLFIEVKTVCNGLDFFAYSLLVAFKQLVYLGINPDLSFDAITWSKMVAGTARETELGKTVRSSVKDSMDIFLNDYLSVNPKQASNPQNMIGNSPSSAVNEKRTTSILDRRGERWDITQAVSIGFKPENFQYGLGRDAIRPLDDTFLRNDSSKAPSHLRIIGISDNSDAQAYSIPKLTRHEIANTTIGSEPIAAAY